MKSFTGALRGEERRTQHRPGAVVRPILIFSRCDRSFESAAGSDNVSAAARMPAPKPPTIRGAHVSHDPCTILLCYDGSPQAEHAVEAAGKLFPHARAYVLYVWEPVERIIARYAVLA